MRTTAIWERDVGFICPVTDAVRRPPAAITATLSASVTVAEATAVNLIIPKKEFVDV